MCPSTRSGSHRARTLGVDTTVNTKSQLDSMDASLVILDLTNELVIAGNHEKPQVDTALAMMGSIHHETGGVCLPVKRLPPELTLQEIVKVSFDRHYCESDEYGNQRDSQAESVVRRNLEDLNGDTYVQVGK